MPALSAGLLISPSSVLGQEDGSSPITRGDIGILRFLSGLEQVEADLWIQYAELGGATNQGLSPIDLVQNGKKINTGLAANYVTALQVLDGDMPQYIVDNTDDEISHHAFLNNCHVEGGKAVDLSHFAILPPSQVTGVPQTGRLTNLKQLKVDTSWWTRYRSPNQNPDLGGTFEDAVPDLASHPHTAIPLNDGDLALNPDAPYPHNAGKGAVKCFVDDGLFIDPSTGENTGIVAVLKQLTEEADEARRHF